MEVKIEKIEDKTMVVLNGRLDTTTADKFMQDITPLMQGDNPDIEMDCTGLEYTSSQGLRMFLLLQKSVTSRKGNLVLKNMKPNVKEVFDITGFSNIIKIV
jgi:anti-anti-sigma factor